MIMIKLDISGFIFAHMLLSAVIILILWTVYIYKRTKMSRRDDMDYMWKCSICSHVYIDSRHEDVSKCPLCGSYNKKEGVVR